MKFTVADVETMMGLPLPKDWWGPRVVVTEDKDGIRISAEAHSYEEQIMDRLMRAALSLRLDPAQVRTNSMELCDCCGEYASPYVDFDVTFLFEPALTGQGGQNG